VEVIGVTIVKHVNSDLLVSAVSGAGHVWAIRGHPAWSTTSVRVEILRPSGQIFHKSALREGRDTPDLYFLERTGATLIALDSTVSLDRINVEVESLGNCTISDGEPVTDEYKLEAIEIALEEQSPESGNSFKTIPEPEGHQKQAGLQRNKTPKGGSAAHKEVAQWESNEQGSEKLGEGAEERVAALVPERGQTRVPKVENPPLGEGASEALTQKKRTPERRGREEPSEEEGQAGAMSRGLPMQFWDDWVDPADMAAMWDYSPVALEWGGKGYQRGLKVLFTRDERNKPYLTMTEMQAVAEIIISRHYRGRVNLVSALFSRTAFLSTSRFNFESPLREAL
jgi:hypothetical protein